jgi:hypothetical protein
MYHYIVILIYNKLNLVIRYKTKIEYLEDFETSIIIQDL